MRLREHRMFPAPHRFHCYSNFNYNGNVEVLAGTALTLASFVLMMAIARMLQNGLKGVGR